jgi:hypothetical protein
MPEFAVRSMADWWKKDGCRMYPAATELLILSNGGGCNSCRARSWKLNLQEKLSDALGLTVTVCHYPSGCSKWNPVEHRLFSYMTAKGLKVKAFLDEDCYRRGQKVTREELARLNLITDDVCPQWNYKLGPRKANS